MICWSAAPFFVIDYIRQIAKACGQGIAYKLDIEILFGGRIDELTVYADTDNINIAVVSFGLTDYSEAVFTLFKLLCKDELVNAVGSDLKACFTALAVNISGVININFTALHGGFGKDTDRDFSFAVGIEFKYIRRAQHCKPFFVHNGTSLSFVKTVHLGNIVISSDRVLGSICRIAESFLGKLGRIGYLVFAVGSKGIQHLLNRGYGAYVVMTDKHYL